MPYLRHTTSILNDDTPNNGDVTGNKFSVVPSDLDQTPDSSQEFYVFVVASQSGGVTAPTTDVIIETSFDGGTSWAEVARATQLTADGTITELPQLKVLGQLVRARKVLGGATKPNSTAVVRLASNGLYSTSDLGA